MVGVATAIAYLRRQIETLPERRNRRAHDPFRNVFVVDIRDIKNAQTALSHGGVSTLHVLADRALQSRVLVHLCQFSTPSQVLLVLVGIGNLLEVAAQYCGRLIMFGDGDGLEAALAAGDKNVAPHEDS